MTAKSRNRLIALGILSSPFLVFFALLVFWAGEPPPPLAPLPNPNGYESLIKAGNMVSNDFQKFDQLTPEKLRELVNKNAEAFQIARTGLQETCHVTLDYSVEQTSRMAHMSALRRLAFAFVAEGKLAEMELRPSDAAKSYLDLVHLANESARGGTVIDALTGLAMEEMGTGRLQKIADHLDTSACRETANGLNTLDSERQPWNEVVQQERDWSRKTFPQLRYRLMALMMRNAVNKAGQGAEQNRNKQESKTRQLIVKLAARAYELDKGTRPASLADLVPEYLKAIPQDPLTGTNMVLSP